MLSVSDADAVKQWIESALAPARQPRITPASLAVHCGVSPQAVNGWRRTGRISKSHLAKAAQLVGSTPDFLQSGVTLVAREPRPTYSANWPFSEIDESSVRALSPGDLLRLEGAILVVASQLGLNLRRPKVRAA